MKNVTGLKEAIMAASVRICKKCSGISAKDLKEIVGKDDVRTGCFGTCAKKHPELKGKAYAKVGKKLIARESKKKLLKAIAAELQ